jgi:hypothetical protein
MSRRFFISGSDRCSMVRPASQRVDKFYSLCIRGVIGDFYPDGFIGFCISWLRLAFAFLGSAFAIFLMHVKLLA